MKQNKLGSYLTSFTEKDWAAYHKFSKSIYSDKSDYQLVINYIKKHKSRYDPGIMDGEYLRKKIRPKASKQVFANVISNLCKHIEKFLVWMEVENDPMMGDTLLLQSLAKRGLTEQFYKQKDKSKKLRDTLPLGLWQHYHEFMAEYLLYFCNMTTDVKVSRYALFEANSKLDGFHDTFKGYLSVEMHNRKVLLKEEWPIPSQSEIEKLDESNNIQKIHKYLICLKYTRDFKYFKALKAILMEEKISLDLSYTIIVHITSFLNVSIVLGKKEFSSELLNLYIYGIDKNILFPNGKIPLVRYLNIILLACGVGEITWSKNFVDKYSKLVGKELEATAKRLGTAHIEFYIDNFEAVIILLRDIKFKDFDFELRAKWLLLSANYELNKDNFDSVEYYINSFIYFVRRNKEITPTLGTSAFLKSANYLLKIANTIQPESVLRNIKEESHLLYRKWLINKTKEKIQ